MMRWMLGILLLAATLGGVGTAQADYYDGLRAADAGRHSEALREWQAAANAGDAKAMLALGRLYMQGLGAPQDYVQAHKWFNLAASRGEVEAVTERDALAGRMASEQVAEAQKQAAAWQPQPAEVPAASGPAGPPPPKAIREAQELLATLGYEPDPPDGQWGERTAQAYQAFVRDANLPVTDTLTPAALKTMRAMARQAGAVSTPKAALPPDALHRAAKAGNLKGLEAALAGGADVNARDERGWTALMYVVDKGYVLLVEPLLTAKAEPDVRAPDGATALFMAAAHGHSEIIEPLIKAGADPMIKGPKGKTATEIAQARYGDLRKALEKGEPPAVIALLAGKTLAEGVEPEELVRKLLERQPGRIFRDCDQCPEMVVVPPGQFRMGDLSGDNWSEDLFSGDKVNRNHPVHEVTINYPFAVGRYEVTFAEWDACMAAGGCAHRAHDQGWGRGTRPVAGVSWDDTQEYVNWLSRETGKPYRLLSEAEWEYVARAGTTTKYWWGDQASHDYENYGRGIMTDGTIRNEDNQIIFAGTSPVGSFKPNAFGLYDMAGNVKEWVADSWQDNYRGAPTDGSARTETEECQFCTPKKVQRGGYYEYGEHGIFVFGRSGEKLGGAFYVGFRVARTLD